MSANDLVTLRELQAKRIQMAFVADEYGGIEGLMTVEDLAEELVGEKRDETDRGVTSVRRHADGSLPLPGHFPIHDLPDVGIELPEGDYATIAGRELQVLGSIPETPVAVLVVNGWRITITGVHHRRIAGFTVSAHTKSDETSRDGTAD